MAVCGPLHLVLSSELLTQHDAYVILEAAGREANEVDERSDRPGGIASFRTALPPSPARHRHHRDHRIGLAANVTRTSSCAPRSRDCGGTSENKPMNATCRQFDTRIARSARLTTEEAAELAAHLAGCGSCRELARALRPVDDIDACT